MIYGIWTFCSAIIAFIISATLGRILIPYLHKLNFGQTILDIGPKWHKKKQGTPIMGGIMFIAAILIVTVISTILYNIFAPKLIDNYFADIAHENVAIFACLGLALVNGLVGLSSACDKHLISFSINKPDTAGFTTLASFAVEVWFL